MDDAFVAVGGRGGGRRRRWWYQPSSAPQASPNAAQLTRATIDPGRYTRLLPQYLGLLSLFLFSFPRRRSFVLRIAMSSMYLRPFQCRCVLQYTIGTPLAASPWCCISTFSTSQNSTMESAVYTAHSVPDVRGVPRDKHGTSSAMSR